MQRPFFAAAFLPSSAPFLARNVRFAPTDLFAAPATARASMEAQGPNGYNKFPAAPGVSKAFWFLHRRGKLRQQAANALNAKR
jgi:hypothetical protein